ncbi:MAG: helix-turn-helix domain-containing protein [Myxococcota bacterium]|nr:helix-turn-helix domain-containing protein [Myxococcota bacterium]
MPKPFKTLRDKMSPERRTRSEARADRMLLELNLQELRQRCTNLTQEDVASLLNVTQAYVSKFERGEDALLSSLYGHIKALGGDLEIRARFPGRPEVRVTQYEDLGRLREAMAAKR